MSNTSEKLEAIFNTVLELPANERASYLDEACLDQPALRERLDTLLQAEARAGDFLEEPAPEAQSIPAMPFVQEARSPTEGAGDRIGRYKLLQQIGEGGCGVVYMAEQEEPVRRRVALKVIKLGMDTKQVVARFEAERQALALMDHENIAKVLDAGTTNTGRPYFVMELVRGIKITDFCDQQSLSTRERLDLFEEVCRAIQHAHQKGVIHRDIKPSNILVTVNDGVPVPKVIDFGIAKATQGRLTDRTLFTAFEQFLGTPAYMSPEQAIMTSQDIDTRSDIYSLGVLLYELLTGQTPFDTKELLASGLDAMRRTIREGEPPRPSTRLSTMLAGDLATVAKSRQTEPIKLIHQTRGDLDWIVMKCLEKDRARRYETANGLAKDVERHLADEPISARPPSRAYAFQKLVRRHRLAFAAAVVISTSIILGLGAATVAVFRIKQAKDDATEKLWASYLAEARARRTSGREGQRFASLEAVQNAATIRPDIAVRNEAIASLAVPDLRVSKEVILNGHAPNDLVCYDLNLEKYAVGDTNGSITIRAVPDNRVVAILPAPGFRVGRIRRFSPDSRFLRVVYKDKGENHGEWVWDIEKQIAVLKELPSGIPTGVPGDLAGNLAGDFSFDSRLFARCQLDGSLSIYDLGSGKELKRFSGHRLFNHLHLNPGNTLLACSSETDATMEIRQVESGRMVAQWACPVGVSAMAWSPDSKRLATGCLDFRIYVWDPETGQRQAVLEGPYALIVNLAFNHLGNLLASSSWDGLDRLWNPYNGRLVASYPGGSEQLQFSPDDRQLLGWQNVAHFGSLEVAMGRESRLFYVQRILTNSTISGPEFSADGRILAAESGNQVRFWDTPSGKEIGSFPLALCDTCIFHPDGQKVIVADWSDGLSIRTLELNDGPTSLAYRLGKPRRFYAGQMLCESALSRDGRHLATTHEPQDESLVFDLRDPFAKPVILRPHPRVDRIAISPDGRWVATASWHNSLVKVWDARSGDLVRTMNMPKRTLVAFSPDGRWLATSTSEYQLWEVGTWQPKGPPMPGNDVPEWNFTAFSPDSRVMARTMDRHKIQLLETLTAKPLATLEAPGAIGLKNFRFSPDGTVLAAMQLDEQVRLWDLRLIRQELKPMGLDWDLPPFPALEKTAAGPVTLEVETDVPSSALSQ